MEEAARRLSEFMDKRTIGYERLYGWTWRGQGYDEGWEEPTREDLEKLHVFLGEWLDKSKEA